MSGTVLADVTSANVVGYQNNGLTGGNKNDFVVRTLLPVGKAWTEVNLGDLVGTDNGDDAIWDAWNDILYTLEPNGLYSERYCYVGPTYSASDFENCPIGWYKFDDTDSGNCNEDTLQNKVPLNMKQGFKVKSTQPKDLITLNNAGEVLAEGWHEITLTGGNKNDFTGNITPVDINLGDIVGTDNGDDAIWDAWNDILYTLEPNGLYSERYCYVGPTYSASDFENCPIGWYKFDDTDSGNCNEDTLQNEKVQFKAGQAFKVKSTQSAGLIKLFIPSALGTGTKK